MIRSPITALQLSIVGVASALPAIIFSPGIFSHDSLDQYAQALSGSFNDWHPPLMAVVLAAVQRFGAGVSFLIFAQCVAGAWGLRSAILQAALLWPVPPERISRLTWIATGASLLFLVPINPFPFYLVTFWKDTWVAILLLWLIAYLGWLIRQEDPPLLHVLGLSLLASLSLSIRHNVPLTLGSVGLGLGAVYRQKVDKTARFAIFACPIFFAVLLQQSINLAFHVRSMEIGDAMKSFELVKITRDPELRGEFPNAAGIHGSQAAPDTNVIGHSQNPLQWDKFKVVKSSPQIKSEYHWAMLAHPLTLASIKFRMFRQMFYCDRSTWIHQRIDPNEFGLEWDPRFERARFMSYYLINALAARPYAAWIFTKHSVWLALNTLWMLYAIFRRSRSQILLLSIPLSYYLFYVLASAIPDYRYMYPATLGVQALLCAAVAGRFCTPKMR
jgi:hypothetical protein